MPFLKIVANLWYETTYLLANNKNRMSLGMWFTSQTHQS